MNSSVLFISLVMFAVYLRMIWPSFNNEESQIHETYDFRLSNKTWYGL